MSLDNPILEKPILADLPFVEASLNYLKQTADKPVYYMDEPPTGTPRDSASYEARRLPIRNARSLSQDFSLDRQGFALTVYPSRVRDFYDENEIRSVYYSEAESLLKEVTGAARVLIFDHNIRNAERSKRGEKGIYEPVNRVHNDFTAQSGYDRARIVLARFGVDDPESFLRHRFSIINVWRPIAEPIQTSPLAVCDARSIAPADLVTRALVYRDRLGETYAIKYNLAHQWFYFPQMRCDEALLIKCFDSEGDRAQFTAHTAFNDPTSPLDAPSRESIELRSLVFYPA